MFCAECDQELPKHAAECPVHDDPNIENWASAEGVTTDLSGESFEDRYLLIKRLGRGGMGSVYQARQLNLDRTVAVKVMRSEIAARADFVSRFRSEAKIVSLLRHPNTLKLFDYGQTSDGRLFIVTELLNGKSLDEVIADGPLDPRRALTILKQVCLSFDEAHRRGVVHRDLKPANIFLETVGSQEVTKVLDFGLAKLLPQSLLAKHAGRDGRQTSPEAVLGTPTYTSPEQAMAQPVEPRSDLYSLGVVAYECFTGFAPFSGNPGLQLAKHITEDPMPMYQLSPSLKLPNRAHDLVSRLLSKQIDERPPSASAVAEEIDAILRTMDSSEAKSWFRVGNGHAIGVSIIALALGIFFLSDFGKSEARQALTNPLLQTKKLQKLSPEDVLTDVLVLTTPPAAEVKDNRGKVLGRTPLTVQVEAKTPRELSVGLEGYAARTFRLMGNEVKYSVTLASLPKPPTKDTMPKKRVFRGSLLVEAWTTGGRSVPAVVRIDGKEMAGRTPMTVRVPTGKRRIEIKAADYPVKIKNINKTTKHEEVTVVVDME